MGVEVVGAKGGKEFFATGQLASETHLESVLFDGHRELLTSTKVKREHRFSTLLIRSKNAPRGHRRPANCERVGLGRFWGAGRWGSAVGGLT